MAAAIDVSADGRYLLAKDGASVVRIDQQSGVRTVIDSGITYAALSGDGQVVWATKDRLDPDGETRWSTERWTASEGLRALPPVATLAVPSGIDTDCHGSVAVVDTSGLALFEVTPAGKWNGINPQKGLELPQGAHHARISEDGRYVVATVWRNYCLLGLGNCIELRRLDRKTGEWLLVSMEGVGTTADTGDSLGDDISPAISADGTVIAWFSNTQTLVPGVPTTGLGDTRYRVYVKNLVTGHLEVLGMAGNSSQDYGVRALDVSGDGSVIVWQGIASPPSSTDNTSPELAVAVWGSDGAYHSQVLTTTPNGAPSNGLSSRPVISSDGRTVVFTTNATNLVPAAAPTGVVARLVP